MARGDYQQGQLSGKPQSLGELTGGAGIEIEPVTSMHMDAIELEKFMEELVVINVHKTAEKGALAVITPSVNGRNQPIVRGVNTPVKRKYVEALLMSHSVNYEQQINANSPDQYNMVKRTTPSYPFSVIQDTPKGYDWKERLERSLESQI